MPVALILLAAFVIGAGAVAAVFAAMRFLPEHMERRRIERRMFEPNVDETSATAETTIVKQDSEGPLPQLERAISRTSAGGGLNRLIEQSGSRVSASTIVMASLGCAGAFALAMSMAIHLWWAQAVAAVIGLSLPFLVLRHRRSVRMKRFEEQFPEALDLLSRALRAGHAFATAMGMVASEAPEPIGQEFRKTFDEQNFGLPMKEALNNLAARVPLLDVRFFVTAVLIQRETGGNLSEILDNLAYVVRERFKVLRQVRVYTAHGRFTGWVLMALPAALALVLMFINPEHMGLLFEERSGQMMLTAAVVLQIIGYIWIRRVVKIEV